MQYQSNPSGQFGNQFIQNRNPLAGLNMSAGGYEYDINIPSKNNVIPESTSNHSSVVGHYQELVPSANNNSSTNFGSIGMANINVKKSMMKINAANDIRDREMDMSPKGSELNSINFNN